MKKSAKLILTLPLIALFAAGLAFAAAEKSDSKMPACCTKAKAEGKACATHPSCPGDACKTADNCAKCKDCGKMEKKPETKK